MKKDFDLRELFQYINETALFKNQWQLKTASQEDYVRLVEEKYRPIKKELEEEIVREGWFEPKVVYGYFPAQSDGNDVMVYEPAIARASTRRAKGHGFRRADQVGPKLRLSPRDSRDPALHLPAPARRAQAVHLRFLRSQVVRQDGCDRPVAGDHRRQGVASETQRLFRGRRVHEVSLPARPQRGNGGSAGRVHAQARCARSWASPARTRRRISDLFHQKYRGSRYSFGYPACPNLEDQTKLFALLNPEENVGVRLTTGFLLEPEQIDVGDRGASSGSEVFRGVMSRRFRGVSAVGFP